MKHKVCMSQEGTNQVIVSLYLLLIIKRSLPLLVILLHLYTLISTINWYLDNTRYSLSCNYSLEYNIFLTAFLISN